jgi:hypothetical protein
MHSVFLRPGKAVASGETHTDPDKLSRSFENKASLVLFESKNGTDWTLAKSPLVSRNELRWEDGQLQVVSLLDRPQLFIEDGKPRAMLCAVKVSDTETFNVIIPLKFK